MHRFLFVIFFFSFVVNAKCQTIDFTFQSSNGLLCTPSTIVFKQTCTGNPQSFIWSFGNNLYSDKPIDYTTYLSPGTYTVKLVAIFAKNALELYKTIVINPAVTAIIGLDRNYLCQPGAINFTGSGSGNINSYEWDFGDGTAIVNTPNNNISHNFGNFGNKTVKLKTKSNAGCSDTTHAIITIKQFEINGSHSLINPCIPIPVKFTSGVSLPVNSSVKSYEWDFGDGSPHYISTFDTAMHTYLFAGDFIAKLTVTTNEGCTNTYNYEKLELRAPPADLVTYAQKSTICASDSMVLIAKTSSESTYYWTFGDESPNGTQFSPDSVIKHKYDMLGDIRVYVSAYNRNCGPVEGTFMIKIKGVLAKYTFSNTCTDRNIYSFSDTSIGVPTSTLWDFNHGIQQANIKNIVHNFPVTGQYKSSLFLSDTISGCKDSISRMIYTAQPQLFTADSSVCINSPISFSILNNYTNPAAKYTWNVVGEKIDTTAKAVIILNTDTLGNHINFVSINYGKESCPDTIDLNRTILVRGPDLSFTAPTPICLNSTLSVTNNSKPFVASDSVKHWYWNFGNSNKIDSVFQPAPFKYVIEGLYDVQLIAIDKNGCVDTLTKIVQVNPAPYLHILPANATVCLGKTVKMIAYHNNDILWSANNTLSCTACDTTIATPLVSGNYYATATNSFNCSVKDSSYIDVIFPFTATINPVDVYICQKEGTTVDVNPKGKKILWSPSTGLSNANAYSTFIAPLQSTIYTATLTDSAGCLNTSSAILNVHVKSLPLVNAGPDRFLPKGTNFSMAPSYSSNANVFLWTPSALLNCNSCPTPNGIATYSQKYVLKVTSDSGCVASDEVLIGIECKYANIFIPKAFTPNNDNLNDFFYPITIGVKSILKFTVYNRQGQVVYEARNFPPNDKSFGWNGKFKGTNQAVDTYVYTLEALCEIGEKLYKRDSFLLIK